MARSAANDPLEKFRFQVDFTIPNSAGTGAGTAMTRTGFHDCQMPKRTTNKIAYREGQHPDINTQSAGLTAFEDVAMSRGVIAGDSAAANDLYNWMSRVHKPTASDRAPGSAQESDGALGYRAEVVIKMLDRTGKCVRAWTLYQAWPTAFNPGSDLNAGEDGEKSLEGLTLGYEDFQEMSVDATGAVGAALTPLA